MKMVNYKVFHAPVSELARPLVEYFQLASSWHRLKKSVQHGFHGTVETYKG